MGLVQDPTPVDYKGMIKEGLKNVGTNYVMDKLGLEGKYCLHDSVVYFKQRTKRLHNP